MTIFFVVAGLRKTDGTSTGTQVPAVVSPAYPNQAAVFAEQKGCSWGYSNRLVAPAQPSPWFIPRVIGGPQCTQCPGVCPVPRSSSNPGTSSNVRFFIYLTMLYLLIVLRNLMSVGNNYLVVLRHNF